MKKTIVVTITKEIEIEISDDMFTDESMKEFSEGIFPVNEPYEIFFHAAAQVAMYGGHFVDGVGEASECYTLDGELSDGNEARFKECVISVDCDEIKC